MRIDEVLQYFQNKGYPEHVAAGIAGNLGQESSLDPNAINPKSGAFGLAQWLGPRKESLQQFAQQQGSYASDPGTQLDFIHHELNTTEKRARDALMKAQSPAEAAVTFSNKFERAGVNERNNDRRVSLAEKAMNFIIPTASADETPYTNEELAKIAGVTLVQDEPAQPPQYTNEELAAIAGVKLLPDESSKVQYEGRNIQDMSVPSQVLTGAGNAVINLGRGLADFTGLHGETGFGSAQDIAQNRKVTEELNKTGGGFAGGLIGAIAPTLLTGGMTSIPAVLAEGAAYGALQPTIEGESRLKNTLYGAGGGLAGKALGAGLGKVVGGFKPSADAIALMKKGVQPSVGQGIDQSGVIGQGIRKFEEATTSLPFLGATTTHARARALKEFTRAAIGEAEDKTLGISAKGATGHEAITNLKDTFNKAYESTLAGHSVPIKPSFGQSISDAVHDPANFVNDTERTTILKGLQGLFDKISPDANGNYLASDLFKIESSLKKQVRTLPNGDPKAGILSNVRSLLTDYREANLPPTVGEKIQKINSKYANFVRMREASAGVGAEHGNWSPAQLYNKAVVMGKQGRATGSAPMQEIAGQGKAVLGDKLVDSGTASRVLSNKMLAGGALEGAATYAALPQMAALGATMLGGSTRPAQKLLLGGYGFQPGAKQYFNSIEDILGALGADLMVNKK